jgi:release factor glutamine methyltransferase
MLDAMAELQFQGKSVLDIGTGSGILGLFCATRGAYVTVTDIEQASLRYAKQAALSLGLAIELVLSDMFLGLRGRFDTILFNPPYLPSSSIHDATIDGGKDGSSLSRRFLHSLPEVLKLDGFGILLVSSVNRPESLISENPNFEFFPMARRKLFFEEIEVLGIRLRYGFPS